MNCFMNNLVKEEDSPPTPTMCSECAEKSICETRRSTRSFQKGIYHIVVSHDFYHTFG